MALVFHTTRRVEFADTDMAGIVHFANFFRYMEVTEHAFLRSLGLSVHMREGRRTLGLPRVSATCDYRVPLRYEERVTVVAARIDPSTYVEQFNALREL